MNEYIFLISLAIILLTTKILGDVTNKVNMTQVVGALLAGVLIGPSCLDWVTETDFVEKAAEIGVILLMFTAGLDTDVKQLKKNSVACIVIASIGVLVPLVCGAMAYYFYFEAGANDYEEILKAVFIGVVLTATSVSITVEALREMGKLDGKVGSAILGAAVIDDIMGIVVLTIVISMKDSSVSILLVLGKILLYAVLMILLGIACKRAQARIDSNLGHRRITTYVVAACFIIAYISESYFGVADITGAYLLGLFLSQHEIKQEIARLYRENRNLMKEDIFGEGERELYYRTTVKMDDVTAQDSLRNLSEWMERYYGRKTIILMDEYDTPMQEAYVQGYWDEFTSFIRGLFNSAFKTNPYLERAVMTGITRVSKESVFSDLNNLKVITITSDEYADCFGFTEAEVFAALEQTGLGDKKTDVKEWYDGFTFGSLRDIYNPWSITNYLDTRIVVLEELCKNCSVCI